jgi:hypothetical protein
MIQISRAWQRGIPMAVNGQMLRAEVLLSSQSASRRGDGRLAAKRSAKFSIGKIHLFAIRSGSPICHQQAALRYANCLAGLSIPPLNW